VQQTEVNCTQKRWIQPTGHYGPPERARAETGAADQWVLKRSELPGFARVNKVTSASLGYLSVLNKNSTFKRENDFPFHKKIDMRIFPTKHTIFAAVPTHLLVTAKHNVSQNLHELRLIVDLRGLRLRPVQQRKGKLESRSP